jgi:hypothetical protein
VSGFQHLTTKPGIGHPRTIKTVCLTPLGRFWSGFRLCDATLGWFSHMWCHVSPNNGSKGKRERHRGLNGNDDLPHGQTEERIRGSLPAQLRPGRGGIERGTRGVYSPPQLRRMRYREAPPRRRAESGGIGTGGGAVEYGRGRELPGEVQYGRGRTRWSMGEGRSRWASRAMCGGVLPPATRPPSRVEGRWRRIHVAGGEGVDASTRPQRQHQWAQCNIGPLSSSSSSSSAS